MKDYISDLESRAMFFDEDLLVVDDLKDFYVEGKIKVDAYILLLCTRGHGTMTLNDKKYVLQQNDLFICRPSHILEALMLSVDFECTCVGTTKEFMQNILMMSNNSWNLRIYIENNPVVHICEQDAELIARYASLIKVTMTQKNKRKYKGIITALMCALAFEFSDMLEHVIKTDEPTYTTAEKTFNDFFDLLTSTSPRRHPVAYYADKLHLTSKYLSVISKKVSGKSALELITEYTIKEIETRLQKPDKTIKGVAVELGFENVSYFSKYFRHYTGTSPKKYREEFHEKQRLSELADHT